jgi:PhnB protein
MNTAFKVHPYLNFNGTAEEAFKFYRSVFGGDFAVLQRFKDMPAGERPLPEHERDKVMHVALPIGEGTILMGSDVPESMGKKLVMGNSTYISLHPGSKAEAQRLYEALSSGGKIEMPLGKVFWGAYYASFADKFGVQWMINYTER